MSNPTDPGNTVTRYTQTFGVDIDDFDGSVFKHPGKIGPGSLGFAKFPDFINDNDISYFNDPYAIQCKKGFTVRQILERK